MRTWAAPQVPTISTSVKPSPALRVFDSASQTLRLASAGPVSSLYVCGITPYDATHVGHAATYVAFDLLVRAWLDAGHDVRYVQNVTDVDDPLLERARHTGQAWRHLAERETELFRTDMSALRVIPPTDYVGAVEAIPLVLRLIEQLSQRGAVYEIDGDWYFAVASDPRFGAVSGLSRPRMLQLFAERGGDPDRPGKKDPLDCLVWQRQRQGEPSWDSELGPGRPGWHVECTAMAREYLGPGFDVQGGGSDLAFPHHEMCAAGGHVAADGRPFAKAYVHAGMVGLDGEKMSKSLGNLVFVSTLRAQSIDPMAIRLALLHHHYRSDWSWSGDDLTQAQQRLAHWRAAVSTARATSAETLVAGVREDLARDLDAPAALRAVDRWSDTALAGTGGADGEAGSVVRRLCDSRLGILL